MLLAELVNEKSGPAQSVWAEYLHPQRSAGDGYSSRAADSILNGCIPVVIMDDVDACFETVLDWSLFSVRVPEVRPRAARLSLEAPSQAPDSG